MASADLIGQMLLGQLGQAGQRQDPRRALAARLMAGSPPAAPINSWSSALAYGLSQGLEGWAGRRMEAEAEQRDNARRQELMGQVLQREQQQNEEAVRRRAELYGIALNPGSAPAAMPGGGGMQPPGAAPAAAAGPADGDPRSLNMEAARRREAVLGNTSLTPEQQAQGLAEVSAWRAGAGGTPPIPGGYRANPGVDGAFAGVAPPSGMVPPVVPGGGAPAAGQGSQQINMQVLQEMLASPNPRVRDEAQAALQVLQYQRLAGPLPPEVEAQRIRINQAGRPSINVGGSTMVGTIPPGYQASRMPDGTVRMEPIPGGPADRTVQRENRAEAARLTQQQRQGNIVVQDVDRILGLVDSSWFPTTGSGGSLLSRIPGTAAADVARLLDTLGAEAAFSRLQQMREASPTGGALGQVTERELALLQATMGSLSQSQSAQQFRDNLNRFRNTYLDIIHGPGQGPPRSRLSFEAPSTQPPEQGGGWSIQPVP